LDNTVPYDAAAAGLIRTRIVTVFTGYVGIPRCSPRWKRI
jgi:hypothetical protein